MTFQCYTPRASLGSTPVGGLFISSDGNRCIIPDYCLNQAELLNGSRLLRLNYSSCIVEVAGRGLGPIFEDVSIGKLGEIQTAPRDMAPGIEPWVSSIVTLPLPQSLFPVSGEERFDG